MKQIFKLDFISLSKNIIVTINSLENFLDFIRIFDPCFVINDKKVTWNTIQQKDTILLDRIATLIDSNLKKNSSLKRLFHDFFKDLSEGECFFILNHVERTTLEFTQLWKKLDQMNVRTINSIFDEGKYDWGTTVLNYNIDFIGTERKSFGHFTGVGIKMCRFCKGYEGQENVFGHTVVFRKKAHLISEALGNKNLISLDECDYCNDYFSQTIEPSIVSHFSPFRSLYGINGKGGKKKLKGKNFELDPEIGFNVQLPSNLSDYLGSSFSVPLNLLDTFKPANVYKCLVKFLLAVLSRKELVHYQVAVQWLFESKMISLPSLAWMKHSSFYTKHPYLIKYKRNNSNYNTPDLIGEFRYADIAIIFIVPFSDLDQKQFLDQDEINTFWESFIGFRKDMFWNFLDYSSTKPVRMQIDLQVNNVKIGENAFLSKEKE